MTVEPILFEKQKKEVTIAELKATMKDYKEVFRGVFNTEIKRREIKKQILDKLNEYEVVDVAGIKGWDVKVFQSAERAIGITIDPIYYEGFHDGMIRL